ncbi:MAG: PilW family protein [Dokdonella sp.]
MDFRFRDSQRGISLIELLVALAIAALLLLGLSQVFIGSKDAYRLQEGMSRVQENARFVTQYLEQNVRMAGYMGCGNDIDLTNKSGTPPAFLNHLRRITSGLGVAPPIQDALTAVERFQRPIEGFTYTGATVDSIPLAVGAAADWTPVLDSLDTGSLIDSPAKGSDILMLRIISDESTPLNGNFDMAAGSFSVTDPTFVEPLKTYAITNCSNARIFRASARPVGTNPVLALPADNLLKLVPTATSTWTGTFANLQFNQSGTILNAEVHKAEYLAIYVGLRPDPVNGPVPVLKVVSDGVVNELADNVEIMRLWYGVDTNGDGAVDKYVRANDPPLNDVSSKNARDAAWRKVLSVRIALLMRSQDSASVVAHTGTTARDNVFKYFDASSKRPDDRRFRDVYTTTIALRNRLGNY